MSQPRVRGAERPLAGGHQHDDAPAGREMFFQFGQHGAVVLDMFQHIHQHDGVKFFARRDHVVQRFDGGAAPRRRFSAAQFFRGAG